jgi:prepilin signal peptidase PulO-like enzyme (type II secretory pathway)
MIALAVSAYLVLVALLVGSFINMAADRVPRGESLVRPGSHCRACGRQLNLIDLIPVVGYLIRHGRCATCGVSIGASSPAIEATCGAAMLSSVTLLGPYQGALAGFAMVALLGFGAVGVAARRGSRAG